MVCLPMVALRACPKNVEKNEMAKKTKQDAVGEMIEKLASAKSMAEMGNVVDESLV